MKQLRPVLRLVGRIGVVCVAVSFISLVGLQYARIIGKNVALAQELHGVDVDVHMLQAKRIEQERTIRRLSDPRGAIPEIHDKLHLVGDHEAIIYLKKHGDGP
ncbi:MAG: hypothetical protein NVSMB64_05890 [Candidatus Velthaea sp.]